MKLTLYENADEFLEDNRQFICTNSLEADLVYGNAHSSTGKDEGFYGASVKNGGETLLSIQIKSYPRVHFSDAEDPAAMAKVLAQSYMESDCIPNKINGDRKTVSALIKYFKEHSIEYKLHMDLLKRKCIKLIDAPAPNLKMVNAQSLDFNFVDYYIAFAVECHMSYNADEVPKRVEEIISKGNLYALLKDDTIVAIAASSRKTENGRAVNLVYTPPEYRGNGYSTSLVKQLTKKLLSEYDYAFLYTDRANPISNHVYEKLGYEVFAEFCEYNKADK